MGSVSGSVYCCLIGNRFADLRMLSIKKTLHRSSKLGWEKNPASHNDVVIYLRSSRNRGMNNEKTGNAAWVNSSDLTFANFVVV